MDPEKIEALITPKTTAIVPVHVYGNICNVREIQRIADKHGLKVIYDAAHAFGETLDGEGVGNFGDLSMFSFHATKVFHTIEGGAVVCRDKQMYAKLTAMKNFGLYISEDVREVAGNAKMNEFQAAMGICNLRILDGEIAKRQKVVEVYRRNLSGVAGLYTCPAQKNVHANFAYFPLVVAPEIFGETRDQLCDRLGSKGVFPRKYFYPLTSSFNCYEGRFPVQKTPVAEHIARNVVTIPLYADMTEEDAQYVCNMILEEK